ncbi:MAG: hypothetical protein J7497_10825 [Chitinophagaceae bacterium]|nr:hypothetical protein [Chitinophagaceae bacterium]
MAVVQSIPSLFVNTTRPSGLEFNIVKGCRSHSYDLADENGNVFLTGITSGTISEILHEIRELKKAVCKPGRFEKELLNDCESIYFVINDASGYPIASSFLFFSHRDCRNMISVLKILIPTARVNAIVKNSDTKSAITFLNF